MRIVCPACAATYEVPDGRLLPGRVVRCARCDTDWAPVAEVAPVEPEPLAALPEPVPEPPSEPEPVVAPEPEPEIPAQAREPVAMASGTKHVNALRAAWAASALVLLVALWFAYSARDGVMHSWPPSIRAYAALGLAKR